MRAQRRDEPLEVLEGPLVDDVDVLGQAGRAVSGRGGATYDDHLDTLGGSTLPSTDDIPYVLVLTVVHGDFEWDADKAARNIAKHGVSFEEAASAMSDPVSQDFADGLQPANLVTLAATSFGRILYIVSTERDRRIRIISARDATRHERRRYEEAK